MSYVVLARKYRPQRFDDMIGQEHVGRTLGNAIRQNRVHHAYLFAGARGLGKTTTARILAKGLVCERGPTATPCNACSECVAVNEGRSVDVVEIDGASNNSVENIRNLREQVNYLPQTARRKVYIIDEVHMLTTSAFNALLKTLEEPPPHVNFIFATTEPHKVLPTILSRVSRLDFRRVSPEEAMALLRDILEREELSVDEGGLRLVARASGGSVRDALTLLDQVIAFADEPKAVTEEEARAVLGQAQRGAIAELVDAVIDRDADAVLARFDALVNAGHDLMVLSLQLLEHFRDLAVVKVCKGPGVLRGATDAEYEQAKAQAAKAEATVLGQLFDRFTRVVDRLPQSRVPRLLLEMGLLDLVHAEPLMPLGDLLDQLHAFADGGSAPGAASSGSAPSHGAGPRSRAGGTTHRADASLSSHLDSDHREASTPPPSGFDPGTPPARISPDADSSSSRIAPANDDAASSSSRLAPAHADAHSPPSRSAPAHADAHSPSASRTAHADAHSPSPGGEPTSSGAGPGETQDGDPSRAMIGVEDSDFSRELWAKVRSDLGDAAGAQGRDGGGESSRGEADNGAHVEGGGFGDARRDPESAGHGGTEGPADIAPGRRDGNGQARRGDARVAPHGPVNGDARRGDPSATRPSPGDDGTAGASAPRACGPCSPQAAADGLIAQAGREPFAVWEELVARIRGVDEYASAVLSDLALLELSGGLLRVAAPPRSFAYTELASRPDLRATLEQACRDHLGAPHEVQLVEGEPELPARPSIVLVDAQRRAAHQAAVEAEAAQHASIRALLRTFNATITHTKPIQ